MLEQPHCNSQLITPKLGSFGRQDVYWAYLSKPIHFYTKPSKLCCPQAKLTEVIQVELSNQHQNKHRQLKPRQKKNESLYNKAIIYTRKIYQVEIYHGRYYLNKYMSTPNKLHNWNE